MMGERIVIVRGYMCRVLHLCEDTIDGSVLVTDGLEQQPTAAAHALAGEADP